MEEILNTFVLDEENEVREFLSIIRYNLQGN